MINLYDGVKTWVRVDSEEFDVKLGMHQAVLSHFPFAIVLDVFTEFAREGVLSKLLYANDLVLMSQTIVGLRNKFL